MSIVRHETGPRMSQVNIHNGVVYLAGQVGSGDGVGERTHCGGEPRAGLIIHLVGHEESLA